VEEYALLSRCDAPQHEGEGARILPKRTQGGCVPDPSEKPTCGCRKRPPTSAPCFRPVIYRELCNENV
jgi:hypothetical protein